MERVKLLAQENAQLRAEVGSMKDRLQVLERIAVDRSQPPGRRNRRAAPQGDQLNR